MHAPIGTGSRKVKHRAKDRTTSLRSHRTETTAPPPNPVKTDNLHRVHDWGDKETDGNGGDSEYCKCRYMPMPCSCTDAH